MSRLARVAWGVLAYNIAVILWGAYVRASGSGAGCGSHWPLCNGEVLPLAASTTTLIEFSHRLTSGLALIAVVALWWRCRSATALPRRMATWSLFFMITEAAVGAGLVLFQLVADNASMARALFMAVHLINTFLLVASLTLTAHFLDDVRPISWARPAPVVAGVVAGALALIVVGTSGAIAALGDTLFPASSLAEALASDLSSTSHLLIRLRILHPALAVTTAAAFVMFVHRFPIAADDTRGKRAASAVLVVAILQVIAGFVNVLLLAPVWMQMLHLLLADVLWIAFVLVAASTLAAPPARQTANA